jgi:hypothetical protein
MSTTVEQSFVKNFQAEVHEAYQRIGSKLRNTVRSKNEVIGSSTTFQKVGKGAASTKARHGKVPVMNIDHTPIECLLADYYAGDWVDKLDEIKTNVDERMVVANAGAYALGHKTDELIINELDQLGASQEAKDVGTGLTDSDGLTKEKVLLAFEMLGAGDVPDDGQRFAIIGWKQWSDLLGIQEFANADYIGDGELPWRGTQAKRWLGALWMPHSGLTTTGSLRYCYWYHKTAVGHASGSDVALWPEPDDVDYECCHRIARRAIAGGLGDPTNGATHYHFVDSCPSWSYGHAPSAWVGGRLFYRLEG